MATGLFLAEFADVSARRVQSTAMKMMDCGFRFGIHPFGLAGMASGVARGAPDDFTRLPGIIDELRGGQPLLLRSYIPFAGNESVPTAMSLLKMFAASGAPWDVVLLFRTDSDDLSGWLQLIEQIVTRFGRTLDTLQITGEPNLLGMPDAGDGARPHVRRALRDGVLLAKETVRATDATVSIGFNAVPTVEGADDFWPAVRGLGDEFAAAVDYVGLDFYPDVFGAAIALEHLPLAVESILRRFREHDLAAGGISPSIPIRITENGWPTGPNRSYEHQAAVLESIIRTVHRLRKELNITDYELFGLRDADSANDISFYQFGIMRDDYTLKPAFNVYQRLIAELSVAH